MSKPTKSTTQSKARNTNRSSNRTKSRDTRRSSRNSARSHHSQKPRQGKIIGLASGYGFIEDLNDGIEFALLPEDMNAVLDKDEVSFTPRDYRVRGKQSASINQVTHRPRTSIFARYFKRDGRDYAAPCSHKIPRSIQLKGLNKQSDIKNNSIVEVKLFDDKDMMLDDSLRGKVIRNLGEGADIRYEIDLAISEFALPNKFSEAALAEAESANMATSNKRRSLVDLPFVTIDGADAQDFDDAIYCKKEGNDWQLWVAIADVSHYVVIDGELDKEASARTSSVYFPSQVVPMLPEHLSNGLCSLNPNEDRLALVCQMTVNNQGETTKKEFYEALIKSRHRLIYEDVGEFVERGCKGNIGKITPDEQAASSVRELHAMTKVLLTMRKKRGALDFAHLEDTQIELDDSGAITRIHQSSRNIAHMMIEEAMLLANTSAALFIKSKDLPFCYRINPSPDKEKMDELRYFLKKYKIKVPPYPPSSKDYCKVLEQVRDFPEAEVLEMAVLRSMTQASYTPRNEGHFGLNYDCYTHFTSPIRRYADLLNHRAIKCILHGDNKTNYPYTAQDIQELGNWCSQTERNINKSVWQVMDALKCHYLEKHGKSKYDGIIVHISERGFFVRIDELPIEGMVRTKSLKDDYYRYNTNERTLQGMKKARTFSIGDKVRVKVDRVNSDERKIDFLLL
ncbi:MAG: ribonuclease R [Candidatus Portiera sp.]|nr:ribonuclease R [Portiera sp.]